MCGLQDKGWQLKKAHSITQNMTKVSYHHKYTYLQFWPTKELMKSSNS